MNQKQRWRVVCSEGSDGLTGLTLLAPTGARAVLSCGSSFKGVATESALVAHMFANEFAGIKDARFENMEDFIKWLENLHNMTPDGAVIGEQWEPARLAVHFLQNQQHYTVDYPEADGTDGAHPAYWRGHHESAAQFCQLVNEILDGKDPGAGTGNAPWEPLRRRLLALVHERPVMRGDALYPDYITPNYAMVRDKRMSELTPEQQSDATELWLRTNLDWFRGDTHRHISFLLNRLDKVRAQAMASAAPAQPLPAIAGWKGHEVRELVSALNEVATKYAGMGQLRANLAMAVHDFLLTVQQRQSKENHAAAMVDIHALFETEENGVVGQTTATVKRIEQNDDGTRTVVIDYWPEVKPNNLTTDLEQVQCVSEQKPTGMARILRDIAADPMWTKHAEISKHTLAEAANELDRYYTGMCAWKRTAEAKDATIAELRAKLAVGAA